MAIVISIANQKGGIGKTTTTYNLAAALSQKGKSVLMVDMDIQCSLTHSCTLSRNLSDYEEYNTCSLFESKTDSLDCCYPVVAFYPDIDWQHLENISDEDWKKINLYIVPSHPRMAQTQREINTVSGVNKFNIFKKNFEVLRKNYDFIILDCLPTLDGLLTASLVVSDGVIIPVKPETMSCDGLVYLLETINSVKNTTDDVLRNQRLCVLGAIITMYRGQSKEHKELSEQLKKKYSVMGVVPLSASVTSGVLEGLPVVKKRPTASAAQEYNKIASLLL